MVKKNLLILLSNLIIIVSLIFAADFISSNDIGAYYHVEQAIQTLLVIVAVRVFQNLFKTIILPIYETARGKPAPHLLKDLVDFFIVAIGFLFVIVVIFDKSIFSIAAAGGLFAAALAIAVQGLIQDIFGAIVIDFDVPFHVGDWLQLSNGIQGKVVEKSWRHTILLTNDQTYVYVPNGQLMREQIINLSQPAPNLVNTLEVSLDHNVPVHRVRRILEAAISNVKAVHHHTCHVYAHAANEGGITYSIRYMIPEHGVWREVRHEVLEAVTKALHQSNLKLSESLGEYALSRAKDKFIYNPPLSSELIIRHNKLFEGAADSVILEAAKLSVRHTFAAGDEIIRHGDLSNSVYLIGEGAVVVEIPESKEHQETILAFPDLFGERAFYMDTERNATVRAKTEVLVLEITREAMKALLIKYPEGYDRITQIIFDRDTALIANSEIASQTKNKIDKLNEIKERIKRLFQKIN